MTDQLKQTPNRRRFLRNSTTIAASSSLMSAPVSWAKTTASKSLVSSQVPNPLTAFASSFDLFQPSYGPTEMAFSGNWPAELRGTLYRNGPARMHRGDMSYQHWFDGDGMVHAFDIGDGRLKHRARMVQTARLKAENEAGRFLWNGYGTSFRHARSTKSADQMNVANISVLPVGGELLALWEAGSAYRLDPSNLQTLGRKVWSSSTDGASFSAHPRVDPNGTIWNFGYASGSGKLLLYKISAAGNLQQAGVVSTPNADLVHDFAVTEKHLVFMLVPISKRRAAANVAFVESLEWHDDRPNLIVVVDKATMAISHRIEVPSFFYYHLGNAWQDGDTIRLPLAPTEGFADLMTSIAAATQGRESKAPADHLLSEFVIDLKNNRAHTQTLPVVNAEFPTYDYRFEGRRSDRLFVLARSAEIPTPAFGFDTVVSVARKAEQVQRYVYPAGKLAEEHVFVPKLNAPEGVGWVIGTHFDWRQRRSGFSVLDAQNISAGPIAQLMLPYGIPMGLHGRFVSQ